MKLQTILLPNENICSEKELYFHIKDDWVIFDGYFNLFYLEKHHKYCNIDKLSLELEVSRDFRIQILHDKDVISEYVFKAGRNSIVLPYSEFDRGVFYFRIKGSMGEQILGCADNSVKRGIRPVYTSVISIKGHYEATCSEYRDAKIAVNICTFRREKYVLRNMRSLVSFLDREDIDGRAPEVGDRMKVFIIDNGQTLNDLEEFQRLVKSNELIEIIPNANTGGTGGFSRGMVEAMNRRQELFLTHLLMMDDDAVFDPDLFVRLYGFLSTLKDENKEITVGGALMREDYQYIQHAAGEWFTDFRVINEHPLVDMRDYETCTADWVTGTEREHNMYGAWWCCCYHMNAITTENLPLPIFVHHDDIQFGMRQTERGIVFLNGISVWHQGFEKVFPGVKQYYNMRNTLITMAMYEPERLRQRFLYWSIRRYIGMLINYRYGDCEFVYRGFMDFLKGKEWILGSDPEAIHKQLMADYKRICPMRELTDEEKELVGSYHYSFADNRNLQKASTDNVTLTPDELREYYNSDRFEGMTYKKLTFNGWILPGKKQLKVITPLDTPWEVFRQKSIFLYEPATGRGTVVKRSNKELFKGIGRMIRMCMASRKLKGKELY